MSFRRETLPLKVYVLVIIVLGIVSLYYYFPSWDYDVALSFVYFLGLVILAEHLQVKMPRGESYVSVSFAMIMAALFVLGPGVAVWVASLGQFTIHDIRYFRRYHYRTLFNMSQIAVSTAAAGTVFLLLGGTPSSIVFPQDVLPIVGACTTYWFFNLLFMVLVLAFSQKMSIIGMWRLNFRWTVPNYLALSPLGVLIAIVYNQLRLPGVLLLLFPLLLARHTFMQYMEMRNTYLSTIKAFVKAIDAKDKYTSGHSERVAQYALEIGQELRLPEEQLEKLEYLALLHDIGKIGVSEAVLNKTETLTDHEFDIIRSHPQIGADIVQGIKFIGSEADIIRFHHERLNGKGYPAGITGDDIPQGAKVVSVADVFDAMTSERVYRGALSVDDAVAELKRCSGTQFEPQIVEAFMRILKRKGEISTDD